MMVQRWRISSNSQLGHLAALRRVGCLWWFKDEEFQAIHNHIREAKAREQVVYDGSKMKNFKQFTTGVRLWRSSQKLSMMVQRWRISSNSQLINEQINCHLGCLWWFKDEEFQAIHNVMTPLETRRLVVYDGSKMKNFKQFTTLSNKSKNVFRLSMMVQRWRISSNSQLTTNVSRVCTSCLWWFKDEEFQAIHNVRASYVMTSKLSMMVQRWRISSNSQLCWHSKPKRTSCLWWFKDEEFQAIHNSESYWMASAEVVYDGSKMKNFKQFTTGLPIVFSVCQLSMMVQRWRISSNSQRGIRHSCQGWCCLWWFKDEEFQAIHNISNRVNVYTIVVYDGSKMKNFKQFTTDYYDECEEQLLSMMVQRWRISSNSQRRGMCLLRSVSCLWWFKDEEFQAIHNHISIPNLPDRVVYDGSKMKNFKQFTTGTWRRKRLLCCLWWFKDEEFQAIHNVVYCLAVGTAVVYDGSKMKNFKQFTTISKKQHVTIRLSMMVQRWRISSNSQQSGTSNGTSNGCLWWFKDEEFQGFFDTNYDSQNVKER